MKRPHHVPSRERELDLAPVNGGVHPALILLGGAFAIGAGTAVVNNIRDRRDGGGAR